MKRLLLLRMYTPADSPHQLRCMTPGQVHSISIAFNETTAVVPLKERAWNPKAVTVGE